MGRWSASCDWCSPFENLLTGLFHYLGPQGSMATGYWNGPLLAIFRTEGTLAGVMDHDISISGSLLLVLGLEVIVD
jgi:hypothetical protein